MSRSKATAISRTSTHTLPRTHLALNSPHTHQLLPQPSQHHPHNPPAQQRHASTQTSLGTTPSPTARKPITPFNDTGAVPWGQLSPAEKLARTTQQSFNLTLILAGGAATLAVVTLLYTDVFSPNSATVQFNRAVSLIRAHTDVRDALGADIGAYGEASWNRWRRNRPIASRVETDSIGTERLNMHFHVEGERGRGVARLLMVRRRDEGNFSFGHLYVDVEGGKRVWVERGEGKKKAPGTFFGVRWS